MPRIFQIFNGPKWRQDAINALQQILPESPAPVWVILFTDYSNARFEPARVSAIEKVKVFTEAGVPVKLITDRNWHSYAISKQELFSSETLKIVQQPLPDSISDFTILNDLDVGISNTRSLPAACEAVTVALFSLGVKGSKKPVAVIGGKGYIGNHLVSMLRNDGYPVISIDEGDSLSILTEAEFIVSTASEAGILTEQYINNTHIVLDLGFEKNRDGIWRGNLTEDAAKIALYATPVPGGMGPAQMAVLIERYQKILK